MAAGDPLICEGLASGSIHNSEVRPGGGAGLRAGMAPAVLYGALNPHWALLVSAMLRAEGLGNLPEGTCACEGLSQARPQL